MRSYERVKYQAVKLSENVEFDPEDFLPRVFKQEVVDVQEKGDEPKEGEEALSKKCVLCSSVEHS